MGFLLGATDKSIWYTRAPLPSPTIDDNMKPQYVVPRRPSPRCCMTWRSCTYMQGRFWNEEIMKGIPEVSIPDRLVPTPLLHRINFVAVQQQRNLSEALFRGVSFDESIPLCASVLCTRNAIFSHRFSNTPRSSHPSVPCAVSRLRYHAHL